MGPCVECGEDAELRRGDDGRFRKHCGSCGHVGGPYTSGQIGRDDEPEQASLDDW